MTTTQNVRIRHLDVLPSPEEIISECPSLCEDDYLFIQESRKTIERILDGVDSRLLVIVGPCSIHNYQEALEYAQRLASFQSKNLFIVMRTYLEKPRTTVGWKGFIYDPDLNGSHDIHKGLSLARNLLINITKLRVPVAVEFLDSITPQYLTDIVSWGAIGARTTESQIHRQLASGLSMPVGFKNLTDGNIEKALNGIKSANHKHTFLGINEKGSACIVETTGNAYAHLVLRGGKQGPNYDYETLSALPKLEKKLIVDCSHDNCCKNYKRQALVAFYTMRVKMTTSLPIGGIMIESNLYSGKQDLTSELKPGVSITDACLGWDDTRYLLEILDRCTVKEETSLEETRQLIAMYDEAILNKNYNIPIYVIPSLRNVNVDTDIMNLASYVDDSLLIATRLALSERVAYLKQQNNPEIYLKKSTSILEAVTKLDIECEIIQKYTPDILPLLTISKKIQTDLIQKQIQQLKIGYLFGKGSFSWEAVNHLRGTHISFPTLLQLYQALDNKEVQFSLIPTHNSKIGSIHSIPDKYQSLTSFSIPIQLALYTNQPSPTYDTLYIEPHVEKEWGYHPLPPYECKHTCSSTRDGIINLLTSSQPALTIASIHVDNPLLTHLITLEEDNNRTYFTLIVCK